MYLDGELRCQEQRRLNNAEEAVGGDDVEEHRSRTDPADRGGAPTVRTSVLILESVEDVDVGRGDPPAAAALEAEHPAETLTQATDLLTLDIQLLADQIGLRAGVPPPPGLAKMDLAAMLFPLLPAPPLITPGGGEGELKQVYGDAGDFVGEEDEVLGEGEHPDAFTCPITLELMTDPVYTADGHTYDRTSITEWLKSNTISPMTGLDLPHKSLFPNVALQAVIVQYNASVNVSSSTVAAAARNGTVI